MESAPKVLEFYGLPACGKTTLCENIIHELGEECVTFKSLGDKFDNLPIWDKLHYINGKILCLYLQLFILLPRPSFNSLRYYKRSIKISSIYSFIHNLYGTSYVVNDHGIVQNIISILFEKEQDLSPKAIKIAERIIKNENISILYKCGISEDVAIQRMKNRNDLIHGRLDSIKEDQKVEHIMSYQKRQFDLISCYLEKNKTVHHVSLNMERTPLAICREVLNDISLLSR